MPDLILARRDEQIRALQDVDLSALDRPDHAEALQFKQGPSAGSPRLLSGSTGTWSGTWTKSPIFFNSSSSFRDF